MNMGPPQRFDPADIGAPDKKPLQVDPDEPYMKNNFLQEEFSELSQMQEDGLFSNAKAASAVLDRMSAKIAGMKAALPAR